MLLKGAQAFLQRPRSIDSAISVGRPRSYSVVMTSRWRAIRSKQSAVVRLVRWSNLRLAVDHRLITDLRLNGVMDKAYFLLSKRRLVGRPPNGTDDAFDVLADGIVAGRIFKANASPVGMSWMWNGLRSARGPHADAWLCRDARRSHDRLRQELAAGVT
jgi:hypothetical protein